MVEAADPSETSVPIYQTTKRYTPKRHFQFPFVLAIYQTPKIYTPKDIFSFILS